MTPLNVLRAVGCLLFPLGTCAGALSGSERLVPQKDYISNRSDIQTAVFSSDGRYVAVGGYGATDKSGELTLWDTQTQKRLRTFEGHTGPVWSCAFSPDGKTLVSGSRDHTVRLWDARTGRELAVLKDAKDGISSVAFSPNGAVVAGAACPWQEAEADRAESGVVFLWDAKTFKLRAELKGHAGPVSAVAFSPDGKTLAVASGKWDKKKKRYVSGEVRLWDFATGKLASVITGHTCDIAALAYRPDGKVLATGSERWTEDDMSDTTGEIILWDTMNNKAVATATVHPGTGVSSLAFSADGKFLASGSMVRGVGTDFGAKLEGELVLFRGDNLKELAKVTDFDNAVSVTTFDPQSRLLAVGHRKQLRLWKLTE